MSPVFKNVHYETILFLPVPEGITITVHPGEYTVGEHFHVFVKRGVFELVEDSEEIVRIEPRLIKYRPRKR